MDRPDIELTTVERVDNNNKINSIAVRYNWVVLLSFGYFIVSLMESDYFLIWRKILNRKYNDDLDKLLDLDIWFYVANSIGYLVSAIAAGNLLTKTFSAKRLIGIGVGIAGILNMILHWIIEVDVFIAVAFTTLQALFEGLIYPSLFVILQIRAPHYASTTLLSIILFGHYFGQCIEPLLSNYIVSLTNSWITSIFLFYGGLGLIWAIIWSLIYKEQPKVSSKLIKISVLLSENFHQSEKKSTKRKVPWRLLLKFKSLYVIAAASFCSSWNSVVVNKFIQTDLTKSYQHGMTVVECFLLIFIPSMIIISGGLNDVIRLRTSNFLARKIVTSGGFILIGILQAYTYYISTEITTLFYVCLTSICVFHGFVLPGFMVYYLDISSKYIPAVASLCLTIMNLAKGMAQTLFADDLIAIFKTHYKLDFVGHSHLETSDRTNNICFAISAILNGIVGVFFIILGSIQWQDPENLSLVDSNQPVEEKTEDDQ